MDVRPATEDAVRVVLDTRRKMDVEFKAYITFKTTYQPRLGQSEDDAFDAACDKVLDEIHDMIETRLQGKVFDIELK